MHYALAEVALRLKGLREDTGLSLEDAARKTGVTPETYAQIEDGSLDFPLTFVYKAAEAFGVDFIEILTGDAPKLSGYTLVRAGQGLNIERRTRFAYQHMAYLFKGKKLEPLVVTAPYEDAAQARPIPLSAHEGQEFDFVLEGQLKVAIGDKIEILNPGDALTYNSGVPHGMIAVGGRDCTFLAVLV